MKNRETVRDILFFCIQSHNDRSLECSKVALDESTVLLSEGSAIDSIELVNIIVDFEEALSLRFGKLISLTSDESMMGVETPFHSIQTLCNFACKLID